MGFVEDRASLADLGCGSSKIIQDLPLAVGLDYSLDKLRYLRKTNRFFGESNLRGAFLLNIPSSLALSALRLQSILMSPMYLKRWQEFCAQEAYLSLVLRTTVECSGGRLNFFTG